MSKFPTPLTMGNGQNIANSKVLVCSGHNSVRSWSEEEEKYLVQTRLRKVPYKHIAALLNKTELACRLHYHQLSHAAARRKQQTHRRSSRSDSSAPSTKSNPNQSVFKKNASSSQDSKSANPLSSPIPMRLKEFTPCILIPQTPPNPTEKNSTKSHDGVSYPSDSQNKSDTHTTSREPSGIISSNTCHASPVLAKANCSTTQSQAEYSNSNMSKISSSHPSTPDSGCRIHSPVKSPFSDRNKLNILNCENLFSKKGNLPTSPDSSPVISNRFRSICDTHRISFWAHIQAEYGPNLPPTQLESLWKAAVSMMRPPTPIENSPLESKSNNLPFSPTHCYLSPDSKSKLTLASPCSGLSSCSTGESHSVYLQRSSPTSGYMQDGNQSTLDSLPSPSLSSTSNANSPCSSCPKPTLTSPAQLPNLSSSNTSIPSILKRQNLLNSENNSFGSSQFTLSTPPAQPRLAQSPSFPSCKDICYSPTMKNDAARTLRPLTLRPLEQISNTLILPLPTPTPTRIQQSLSTLPEMVLPTSLPVSLASATKSSNSPTSHSPLWSNSSSP